MMYPAGVKTEFQSHAGIKRKTGATTPKALRLTADDIGRAVVQLVRRPTPMWIPWRIALFVWLNRNFNNFVDGMIINHFTIPERKDELSVE